MVAVESTMLPLGTQAPEFTLPDTRQQLVSLSDYVGKPVLVVFTCNHCPYAKHVAPQLAKLGNDYRGRIQILAINSNDAASYPDDSPAKMEEESRKRGFTFPYLIDEDQTVARAYGAACTPDFFLFDAGHRLFYRGQMDGTRPTRIASGVYDSESSPATGADLRAAIEVLLNGKPAPTNQKPSIGCNIKWKPGNEPSYFPSH